MKTLALKISACTVVLLMVLSCKKDQRPLVVSKVQAAAKLATTEVLIDKYIFASKEKRLLRIIKLNEAFYAARTEATVKLGIDLNKIRKDDVTIAEKTISLTLPPVEVLNFSYPFEKFIEDKYVCENALLNRITVLDIEDYLRQGEMDIRENLNYMGLVEKTRANTTRMMRGVLAGLGFEEIYIDFKPQQELVGAVLVNENTE